MSYYEKAEARLSRRLAELRDRLDELTSKLPGSYEDARYDDDFYAKLTDQETDCVLPEHLPTVQDVLTAIRRAEAMLWDIRCKKRLAEEQNSLAVIPGQFVLGEFADESDAAQLKLVS